MWNLPLGLAFMCWLEQKFSSTEYCSTAIGLIVWWCSKDRIDLSHVNDTGATFIEPSDYFINDADGILDAFSKCSFMWIGPIL